MTIGLIKGSTIVGIKEEATAASGTIAITNNTLDTGDKVTINGVDFIETTDFAVGGSTTITAENLANAINASTNKLISGVVTASALTGTVTIRAAIPGTSGNSITLAESDGATGNFTLSGATLTGGAFSEGTGIAPAVDTDYLQVQEDGLELKPAKELVERTILTSSIGKVSPRASTKSVTGSIPCEYRAGGAEGKIPQYDTVLRSLLGARRQIRNRITTGSSHTVNTLNITAANTKVQKGDFLVILEAGAHHNCFATDVTSGVVTFAPAMLNAPSNSVQLAKTVTYLPANAKHPTYSLSVYWGNEILEQAIGARTSSMSLESFSTGAIASLKFALEGLSFNEVNGSAPHTPSFDAGLPPLVLNAKVVQNSTVLDLNEVGLSVENTIAFLTSVKSADGRVSSRVSERTISGTINPYKDDTSVANYTKFNQNELFSLIITAQNSSSLAGEFELGSVMGIYLPNCILTEKSVGDQDGILIESLSFSANRGTAGTEEEIYMGLC